jgi:hypothetical protein
MFAEAVKSIQEESTAPQIAKPATSPFARAKKRI